MLNEIQKQISKIQLSAQTDPRFKQSAEVEVTPEAKEYTNRVFKSLLPHFPAWRQSCPEPDDLGRLKNAWTKAIMRHELKTGKKLNVKAGLLACEESDTDWLPSVGKFIKMCDQSNTVLPMAQRALDLFNSGQKQIDSVGKMVTGKHGFDLKNMKAADTGIRFIELYLSYAESNAIEGLEAFALEDMTTTSYDEQKRTREREARSDEENKALDDAAQNDFLSKFNSFLTKDVDIHKEPAKQAKTGVTIGKIKTGSKPTALEQKEKERQLAMIKTLTASQKLK